MKKKIILSLCAIWFLSAFSFAGEVSFTASAPTSVISGEQFRLVFSANQQGKNLQVPDISSFDVLMGPSTSKSTSIQYVNGSMTKMVNISYTYILLGLAPGDYTIPAASIEIDSKKYTSNELRIRVLPPDDPNQVAKSQATTSTQRSQQRSSKEISKDQIFVRQTVSKTNVYEQEALLVTYKLYTRYDLRGFADANFPEYKNFYVQEIDLGNKNQQLVSEHYNGLNYNTLVIKQYLLYPQKSGKITLDKGDIEAIIRIRNNSRQARNPFDNFFDTHQEVKKKIVIPARTITVKPLPKGAPASFNGAVGEFSLQSSISAAAIKANEAVTVKLTLKGNGNFKLIKDPEVDFPNDFDVYDAKIENKVKLSAAGMRGKKVFEFLAIPRFGGEFEVPAVEFSYFDLKTKQYKTLKGQDFQLNVDGSSSKGQQQIGANFTSSNKEKVKELGSDIRFIHPSTSSLVLKSDFLFGTLVFYLAYLLPLFIFIVLLIVLRKQAKANANVALRKTKGANKLAKRRLKLADRFKKENDENHFYEEVMKALWGYLSDKLNIPAADLNKENVQEQLMKHNAPEDLVNEFLTTLSDCEFARFSPSADKALSMEQMFDRSAQLIGKLEQTLK